MNWLSLTWRVELNSGRTEWLDLTTTGKTTKEPGSSAVKRLALMVIGWLPVEWLL